MNPRKNIFYPIIPGKPIENDWFQGKVPLNIMVGTNSVIDSTFCFKHYYSNLKIGLQIGDHVTLWRTSLAAEEKAWISIGSYSYIANASLVCSNSIQIGKYVCIAGGVTITDSDFHPMDPLLRMADTIALSPVGIRNNRPEIVTKPVVIDDYVWIGYNATILKGVHVGKGAIISPGSFVIDDVPAGVTVSGNPAKPI